MSQMTLEKFNKLCGSFMDVGLRDAEVVSGVIDMIVDKAQMEPHFSRCGRMKPNNTRTDELCGVGVFCGFCFSFFWSWLLLSLPFVSIFVVVVCMRLYPPAPVA